MRAASKTVVLVGFYRQGNLGIGYLTSFLRQNGYRVVVVDFEEEPSKVLDAIEAADPVVVGFSLIFQLYIDRFAGLIDYLRDHGVAAHFTMGGHFPSLNYERTLGYLTRLDSVARFEGEHTLLELAEVIGRGGDWRSIAGLAFRRGGEVVATPARPLVADLDSLPFPERTFDPKGILGRRTVQIVASRGCVRTCSFCSIHTFYRTAPGKVVRTRKPSEVVREMRLLHDEYGISVFQFQDDDFPVFGQVWRRWANEFVDELHRADLPGRAIWKISCRADSVDTALFARMREAGLYFVYMGLESGTEEGLKTLHKQITVEQNLRAVELLKGLGLEFEFGFMLFDPSTTFASIAENIEFLRKVVGDGSDALSFCRMIPYDGTPIKDELERTGRLRGTIVAPDYDFLDPRVDRFYLAIRRLLEVTGWVHELHGVSRTLDALRIEAVVAERLFPPLAGFRAYREVLRGTTREYNEILIFTISETCRAYEQGSEVTPPGDALRRRGDALKEQILAERDAFILANQDMLLAELGRGDPLIERREKREELLVAL